MKEFILKNKLQIIMTGTGALCGFLYWRFVGCTSGSCPIQSVWYWSTLWGMAVGYLVGDIINDYLLKRKNKKNEGQVSDDNK